VLRSSENIFFWAFLSCLAIIICRLHINMVPSHLCYWPNTLSLSLRQPPNIAFTHQGHDILSSTSSTSQLDVASFRQQTAVGTNIDERVSFT
jgi:hypothetical protein